MIPYELDGHKVEVPPVGSGAIVLFTGTDPRHVRFALRAQQEFGDRVKGWYQVVRTEGVETTAENSRLPSGIRRAVSALRRPRRVLGKLKRVIRDTVIGGRENRAAVEAAFFAVEIARLKTAAVVEPRIVADPNDQNTLTEIQEIEPFFMLTLGGAIYRKPLLELVRGLSLNQHDGWCPEYRGALTADWTLYHRDLRRFGNTVHIITTGMDSGPIVRRSRPCLVRWDSPYTCFLRNVALGTELMCEIVRDVIAGRSIKAYPQPETQGRTFLFRDLTPQISESIERDFRDGWLGRELDRMRNRW